VVSQVFLRLFRRFRVHSSETRPVTSLGLQGGEEFSESGPNFLNYFQYFKNVQHIFPGGGRKFPPLVTGVSETRIQVRIQDLAKDPRPTQSGNAELTDIEIQSVFTTIQHCINGARIRCFKELKLLVFAQHTTIERRFGLKILFDVEPVQVNR